jgi:hypothetical protein
MADGSWAQDGVLHFRIKDFETPPKALQYLKVRRAPACCAVHQCALLCYAMLCRAVLCCDLMRLTVWWRAAMWAAWGGAPEGQGGSRTSAHHPMHAM